MVSHLLKIKLQHKYNNLRRNIIYLALAVERNAKILYILLI